MTGRGKLKPRYLNWPLTFNFLSNFNISPYRGFSLKLSDLSDSRRSIHGQGDFETQICRFPNPKS